MTRGKVLHAKVELRSNVKLAQWTKREPHWHSGIHHPSHPLPTPDILVQMSSWGSRGVAPISTAFPNSQQHSQRRDTSNTFNASPSRNTFSPVSNQQPPPSGSSRQSNSRATSVSSSSSPFSPSLGAQQQSGNQLLFSSRSNRTIPSSSSSLKGADVDIASPSNYTSAPFSQDNKGSTSIDIAQSNILLVRIDKEKDTKKREQLSRELVEVGFLSSSSSLCERTDTSF